MKSLFPLTFTIVIQFMDPEKLLVGIVLRFILSNSMHRQERGLGLPPAPPFPKGPPPPTFFPDSVGIPSPNPLVLLETPLPSEKTVQEMPSPSSGPTTFSQKVSTGFADTDLPALTWLHVPWSPKGFHHHGDRQTLLCTITHYNNDKL